MQRNQGKVVGGGLALNGERRMVAGGDVMGSPVRASAVYEAMDAQNIRPSRIVSPFGRDAREAHNGN